MKSIPKTLKAIMFGIAIVAAGALPTKNAQASSSAGYVAAGVAGGLVLGTLIGSSRGGYYGGGGGYYQPYYCLLYTSPSPRD